MIIGFAGFILGMVIFFLIISKNEELPKLQEKEEQISSLLKPFYRAGVRIAGQLSALPLFAKDQKKLLTLHPADDAKEITQWFFAQKIAICLLIIFAGCSIAVIVELKESQNGYLQDGNLLKRQEFQKGKYTVCLSASIGENAGEPMTFTVEERQFTMDEIGSMLPSFREKLENAILGDNESVDRITQKLDLVSALKDYPFQITWKSNNEKVLDRYGALGEEIKDEGELVILSAELVYGDYMEIYSIPVMVYPPAVSEREQILQELQKKVEEVFYQSAEKTEIILPEEIDGITVVWSEKKKQSALILLLLALGSSVLVFWGQSNDLEKKIRERSEQMLMDYPEIVSKLTLFIGAGMTVRGAWKKIVMDYSQRRKKGSETRYVYEEMAFTLYEMESGVGELEAYRRFASRSRVQKYVKLIALLEQNVRLGAKGFLAELNREAKDAFEERKSTAKQLGETAGSKLMLPMFLMLGIVMVVIMVPSFLSIGM